jgi:hypothetical protein
LGNEPRLQSDPNLRVAGNSRRDHLINAMAPTFESIREQRRDQMFPTLDSLEIERLRRFGEIRSFAAGEPIGVIGQVAPGLVNGFRRPDGRGSGQFAESALDTLYVARNRGRIDIVAF